MSNTIGSVARLVAVIQGQLAARAPRPPARGRAGVDGAARDPYAQENLHGLIELRVRQIGRDDPQRGRKAFRVFLEAVLLSHFGAAMANDARFHQMVEDVQLAMEGDPACGQLVRQAMEQLLGAG